MFGQTINRTSGKNCSGIPCNFDICGRNGIFCCLVIFTSFNFIQVMVPWIVLYMGVGHLVSNATTRYSDGNFYFRMHVEINAMHVAN